MQAELDNRGVKYSDLFEKSEFVKRLVHARGKGATKGDTSNSSDAPRKSTVDSVDHVPHTSQASPEQALRKEIETMSLSAIRSELASIGVSTQGAFEKRVTICPLILQPAFTLSCPHLQPAFTLSDVSLEIGIRRSAMQGSSREQSWTQITASRQSQPGIQGR